MSPRAPVIVYEDIVSESDYSSDDDDSIYSHHTNPFLPVNDSDEQIESSDDEFAEVF